MIKCGKCKTKKQATEFYKAKNKRGFQGYCKQCMKTYSRKWIKDNPEKHKALHANWQKRNVKKCSEYVRKSLHKCVDRLIKSKIRCNKMNDMRFKYDDDITSLLNG